MRLIATITPWLPWLQGILPYSVLLGGKAAELYYFSILEKSLPSLLARETVFGVARGGNASKAFHEHLFQQGFQRRWLSSAVEKSKPVYYREDLGYLEFRCQETNRRKNPYLEGLLAVPDPMVGLLLENPHIVDLKYTGKKYSVRIPQTGRFVLANGLKINAGEKAALEEKYRASQCLVVIFYLLVLNGELEEEALNDLEEVKPASWVREFQQNLREHGPGTTVWEGARKFYLELFPEVKAVQLTSWYWKFLPKLTKVLQEQKIKD